MIHRRRLLAAAGLAPALAFAGPAAARASADDRARLDTGRLDKALADMVASGRAAGVSALVWQDGAERYFGMAGFADREARRPMARDTLMQIFSMTKPVTGVTLMQLWEQGKFHLDDPLAKYLPDFAEMKVATGGPGSPILRPAARPILIRDLFRHTAGLSYGFGLAPADVAFRAADPLNLANDLQEMGRRVARCPLLFDPGAQWSYSVAADIQALLVETLAGVPFEDQARARVLSPLGMKDTAWTQPAANRPRLAATYNKTAGGLVRQADELTGALNFGPRKLTMGGAGLVSSIDDYARFARMLLNEGELDGVRLLRPSTVRLMATDQLDPAITQRSFLPGKGAMGFGLDFAVRKSPPLNAAENRGAVGEYFWDGAQATLFWVDPYNRLVAVFFVQVRPLDPTLHRDFRAAVYGADYLGPKGD